MSCVPMRFTSPVPLLPPFLRLRISLPFSDTIHLKMPAPSPSLIPLLPLDPSVSLTKVLRRVIA